MVHGGVNGAAKKGYDTAFNMLAEIEYEPGLDAGISPARTAY